MMNSSAMAYNAYKNNSVTYASKEQLLLMLLDGACKYGKLGKQAIIDKDISKAHHSLTRCQDIFTELMVSLDSSAGNWTQELYQVYDFIKGRLVEANLKKDAAILDEVMPLIEEIRAIWQEAHRLSLGGR